MYTITNVSISPLHPERLSNIAGACNDLGTDASASSAKNTILIHDDWPAHNDSQSAKLGCPPRTAVVCAHLSSRTTAKSSTASSRTPESSQRAEALARRFPMPPTQAITRDKRMSKRISELNNIDHFNQYYRSPENITTKEAFKRFLYNPKTGAVFGRTGSSWCKIDFFKFILKVSFEFFNY